MFTSILKLQKGSLFKPIRVCRLWTGINWVSSVCWQCRFAWARKVRQCTENTLDATQPELWQEFLWKTWCYPEYQMLHAKTFGPSNPLLEAQMLSPSVAISQNFLHLPLHLRWTLPWLHHKQRNRVILVECVKLKISDMIITVLWKLRCNS